MAHQEAQSWYTEMPVITRSYVTAACLATLATQLEIITPFHIYFNTQLIFEKYEFWRLITNFLYFGPMGLDLLFHLYFLYRYSRLLEEGSFRGRTADYFFMMLFGATLILMVAPFIDMYFLGAGLTCMLVYVWARRNPQTRMSFLGLFNFTAPYLPWVLLGFSFLLNSSVIVDLIGIGTGHIYWFLEDVYPVNTGRRILKTPAIIKWFFEAPAPRIENVAPPQMQARPGGFNWGEGARLGGQE